MNDKFKLVSVFLGNISLALSAFIIAAILIADLSVKEYGEFVLYQSCIVSWVIISKPPVWQAIVKFSYEIKLNEVLKISYFLELVCYFFTALILFFILYFCFYSVVVENILLIVFSIFFGYFINSGVVLGFFRSQSKFYILSLIQFISSCIKLVFATFYHEDVKVLFISFVFIDGALWVLAFTYVYMEYKRNKDESSLINAISKKRITNFAFWSWGNSISDLPVTQFDRVIIAYLMGLELVGVYNIMKRVSQLLGQIADPISQISFPKFSEMLHEGKVGSIYKIIIKISLLMFLVTIVSLSFTYLLYEMVNEHVFSSKLTLYKNELLMFMSIQGLSLVFVWIHPLFLSVGKMKEGFFIVTFSSLFYVMLLFLLRDMGLAGVLIATILQFFVLISLKVYYVFFNRYTGKVF
ncbi:lipopolysaccharide biosynthesis protein [Shewanella sp. MF05960]|uniref:lipopolysaccharide biosynthesis protein n=1 Tax=Shewanella sp. MF05960 TaxID=3434874 RepID=UPI003D7B4266